MRSGRWLLNEQGTEPGRSEGLARIVRDPVQAGQLRRFEEQPERIGQWAMVLDPERLSIQPPVTVIRLEGQSARLANLSRTAIWTTGGQPGLNSSTPIAPGRPRTAARARRSPRSL